jgi:hypothetical protein
VLRRLGQPAWLVAHFVLFIVFAHFALSRNFGNVAIGFDGSYYFELADNQREWAGPSLGFAVNPLQGMSDIFYPLNTRIMPSFILPYLLTGSTFSREYVVLCSTIVSAELYLSTLILGRSLGFGLPQATIAAWMLPVLSEPYFGLPLIYPIFVNAPTVGTVIASAALMMAIIGRLGASAEGARSIYRDTVLTLMLLALAVFLIAAMPTTIMVWAPGVAALWLGSVIGGDRRERIIKLATPVAVGIVLAVSGPSAFVLGLFTFTVPNFFPAALSNTLIDPTLISIWYGKTGISPLGPILFGLGIVGLLTALIFGHRRLRWQAIVVLLSVAAILALGYVALHRQNWRGPAPVYFEFVMWPIYTVFAVAGLSYWVMFLLRPVSASCRGVFRSAFGHETTCAALGLQVGRASGAVLVFAALVPLVAFARAWGVDNPSPPYAFPPVLTPMISKLSDRIGLVPNGPFRGRVLTLELTNRKQPTGWLDFVTTIFPRFLKTGNDYHAVGLWPYHIPTLFEYSPITSPALFRTVTRLLAWPDDPQIRNVLALRRPDAHILALLGVRFVVTDGALPKPFQPVMTEHTFDDERLSLYEVPDVNLGANAPTEAVLGTSFDDALARISAPGFYASRSVVVFDPVVARDRLSPVSSVDLRVIPGGIAVEATASGRALLVLPFEFSRCLTARYNGTDTNAPQLMRVNALETGVLFEKHLSAQITYFTGLFANSGCRIDDGRDFARLLHPLKGSL